VPAPVAADVHIVVQPAEESQGSGLVADKDGRQQPHRADQNGRPGPEQQEDAGGDEVGPANQSKNAPPARLHPGAFIATTVNRSQNRQESDSAQTQSEKEPSNPAHRVRVTVPDKNDSQEQQQHPCSLAEAREIRAVLGDVDHEDADDQQAEYPQEHVTEHPSHRLPAGKAASDGQRDRHAHDEQEGRKDQVNKGHRVGILGSMSHPRGNVLQMPDVVHKHHRQNRQSSKHIEGEDSLAVGSGSIQSRVQRRVSHRLSSWTAS